MGNKRGPHQHRNSPWGFEAETIGFGLLLRTLKLDEHDTSLQGYGCHRAIELALFIAKRQNLSIVQTPERLMPQRLYTRPPVALRLRRSLGLAITGAGSLLWLGQLALGMAAP